MAKFIKLTALRRNNEPIVLNIDTIEYMLPIAGSNGTSLISTTHHTKYDVVESMDDILATLDDIGMVISIAKETPHIMESDISQ